MIYLFACLFVCVIILELITVRKLKSKCSKKTKVGGSLRGNQCLQNVWQFPLQAVIFSLPHSSARTSSKLNVGLETNKSYSNWMKLSGYINILWVSSSDQRGIKLEGRSQSAFLLQLPHATA